MVIMLRHTLYKVQNRNTPTAHLLLSARLTKIKKEPCIRQALTCREQHNSSTLTQLENLMNKPMLDMLNHVVFKIFVKISSSKHTVCAIPLLYSPQICRAVQFMAIIKNSSFV